MALSPVACKDHYLLRDGKRFIPIGAHWVPAKTGLHWPIAWDAADLEADYAKMKDLGFNTVRIDLFWAWFEPYPGVYNPQAFEQLDVFIRLSHQYEIYLHPTLFIGGEVGEAYWDVPWRQGRHPHQDPEMLRLQTEHAAEFARRYRGEPAILAWDLTDEPPFWIVAGSTTDAMAINWTRLIAGALRRYDPQHILCVGTSMEDMAHGPFRPDTIAAEVDFFSVHPYTIYTPDRFPDPMLSERGTYGGAFQTTLSRGAGRPVMIHEFGASSAQYSPEKIAAFDRVMLYSGLANGACGFLPWCYTDAAPELFKQTPYLRAPHETQFGLTTWDRQDRPRGSVLRDFARLLARMDFSDVEPAPGEAALIVPHEWAKPHGDFKKLGLTQASPIPYTSVQDGFDTGAANVCITRAWLNAFILARRAGLKVDMPREYSDWAQHPMLLLPAPLTSTELNLAHVHTTFWDGVRQYARSGGVVYVSVCADVAIPEMADLFGAVLADHYPVEESELTFVKDFGEIPAGSVFRYRLDPANPRHWPASVDVLDGEVLAVDQQQRPSIILHDYGRGKVLLCTYPLESYLAETPAAFDRAEDTRRIYRSLAQAGGVQPLFHTDQPSVEIAALVGKGRGYAVLANHQAQKQLVTVSSALHLKAAQHIQADQTTPLALDHNQIQIEVAGYDGAVIAWEE